VGLLSSIIAAIIERMVDLAGAEFDRQRRCARALRELYAALQECHRAFLAYTDNDDYRKWQSAITYSGPDRFSMEYTSRLYDKLALRKKNWARSIEKLAKVIWKNKDALQIFDLDLYKKLDSYYAGEAYHYLNDQTTDEARMRKFINYYESSWPFRGVGEEFEKAEEALARFIRTHVELADFF
jgi:hypothetical protein